MKKDIVNIFFSCDDNYAAYMAVTIASIKENSDSDRIYRLRVLHTKISEKKAKIIKSELSGENFSIDFFDINEKVSAISEKLHTRDYYSKTTYYRMFIPELFPELDKALYLDSDIIVTGNISELYDVKLESELAAAVRDEFVCTSPILSDYVTKRIGLERPEQYFNAGVLLMNLALMRKLRFEEVFLRLLSEVKFAVAQDQDYLNVICRGRVKYLSYDWNFMPLVGAEDIGDAVNLVHFNLDNKPWQRGGLLYDELFWELALRSALSKEITDARSAYTDSDRRRSKEGTERLILAAKSEADDTESTKTVQSKISNIFAEFSL